MQSYFLISLKGQNAEVSTERGYVCFKDVHFFASLATFPNISLDIPQPLSSKNPHVFYSGSLKLHKQWQSFADGGDFEEATTKVCCLVVWLMKYLLLKTINLTWFCGKKTCADLSILTRDFCCSYTHSDMGFLIAYINIPPCPPAGAVLYTRRPCVTACLRITFSMQKYYFYIC